MIRAAGKELDKFYCATDTYGWSNLYSNERAVSHLPDTFLLI